jgi:hypothetical protein
MDSVVNHNRQKNPEQKNQQQPTTTNETKQTTDMSYTTQVTPIHTALGSRKCGLHHARPAAEQPDVLAKPLSNDAFNGKSGPGILGAILGLCAVAVRAVVEQASSVVTAYASAADILNPDELSAWQMDPSNTGDAAQWVPLFSVGVTHIPDQDPGGFDGLLTATPLEFSGHAYPGGVGELNLGKPRTFGALLNVVANNAQEPCDISADPISRQIRLTAAQSLNDANGNAVYNEGDTFLVVQCAWAQPAAPQPFE